MQPVCGNVLKEFKNRIRYAMRDGYGFYFVFNTAMHFYNVDL